MAEEASDAPSDTGSDVELLREEFPSKVDFDHVKHGWWMKEGEYANEPKALIARAAKLRSWIKDRPEKEIVLVAHGYFNHYLTGDVDEKGEQTTPWWSEAELRTYRFVDGEDGAMIEETEDSLERLRGQRRESMVRNVNRPADRRHSLVDFQVDRVES